MTIYIDYFRVHDDWQPKPGATNVEGIYLDSGASLMLPDSITSVGNIELYGSALLTLPSSVTSVGNIYLYGSAQITLPDSITSVGNIRLYDVASLTLPSSVTNVGSIDVHNSASLTLPLGCKVKGHLIADPETAARRMKAVAEAAFSTPKALTMRKWHCGTSHCIAGWAVHLEGEAGYALEKEVGTAAAGVILLGVEAARLFHLSNDEAKAALERILADEPEFAK